MGAAVEEVRKYLRQARAVQDIGHSANALFGAIDALEDVMTEREPSRPIAVRLAAEILQILEDRAHQVITTRNKSVLDRWLDISRDLLETGLADSARLYALMNRIVPVNEGASPSSRIVISLDDLLDY